MGAVRPVLVAERMVTTRGAAPPGLCVYRCQQCTPTTNLVCCRTRCECREFYWHSLGHYLGLDTHDTHLVGHDRTLQPGAVITVEPGASLSDRPVLLHLS